MNDMFICVNHCHTEKKLYDCVHKHIPHLCGVISKQKFLVYSTISITTNKLILNEVHVTVINYDKPEC